MNPAILSMLEKYKCVTILDYENALKEIMQELALLGLWRSKFFEHAAFYGGTALRILYGLDRFSEDLDFSLLKPRAEFNLNRYLTAIRDELEAMGFSVSVVKQDKNINTAIESAFIKTGTKEHLIKIKVPEAISGKIQKNTLLQIKLEVDTDPPPGFQTEAKPLLQPISFSVNTYKKPDLFAGKIHAILQRKWKNRVKGRDYYDFIWYIAHEVPVRLSHLEQRLRQSHGWDNEKPLQQSDLLSLLKKKFSEIDIEVTKRDIMPFIKDPVAIEIWSVEFFLSLLPKLKTE